MTCCYSQNALRDETRDEEEAGDTAKGGSADKSCRGEKDKITDKVRESISKVNSNTAAERVSNKPESIRARPSKGAGS